MISIAVMGFVLLALGAWALRWVRASRIAVGQPRPRATISPVVAQAYGLGGGAVIAGGLALALDAPKISPAVLLLVVLGVGCTAWQLDRLRARRFRGDAALLADWWRRRGLWQLLAGALPIYVAITLAAAMQSQH